MDTRISSILAITELTHCPGMLLEVGDLEAMTALLAGLVYLSARLDSALGITFVKIGVHNTSCKDGALSFDLTSWVTNEHGSNVPSALSSQFSEILPQPSCSPSKYHCHTI